MTDPRPPLRALAESLPPGIAVPVPREWLLAGLSAGGTEFLSVCHHIDDTMEKLTRTVATTLAALKCRGVSLRTLAREAGHDPSLVSRLAKGERNATPAVAAALAAALDRGRRGAPREPR